MMQIAGPCASHETRTFTSFKAKWRSRPNRLKNTDLIGLFAPQIARRASVISAIFCVNYGYTYQYPIWEYAG